MSILVGVFCVESFVLLLMKYTGKWQEVENEEGQILYIKQNSRVLGFIFALLIILIVGLRYRFWDTGDYRNMYMLIGTNIENVFNGTVQRIEKGYLLFTYFLNLINEDSQFLLMVCSIITNGLFIRTIFRESEDVPFSLFLFLSSGFLSTMNGMRQIMAGAVIFSVGVKWSKQIGVKADIAMLMCIVMMATIHKSLLICIPLYWIAKGKRFNFATKSFLVFAFILFAFPRLSSLAIGVLGGAEYSDYQSVSATQGVMRFLVNSIPFLMCVMCNFSTDMDTAEDSNFNWMFNLTVIGFCFNLLALRMVYYIQSRIIGYYHYDMTFLDNSKFFGGQSGHKFLSDGWAWLVNDYKLCKKLKKNINVPWPVSPFIKIVHPENIIFHPDDINNFPQIAIASCNS